MPKTLLDWERNIRYNVVREPLDSFLCRAAPAPPASTRSTWPAININNQHQGSPSGRRTRNIFMRIRILQIRNPPAPIMQKYRCTSESLESVIRKDPNYFAGSTLVPRIRIQINNPDPDLTTSVYRKFASHHKVKWSHKHWCRKTHFLLTFLNDCSKFYQGFKKIAKKKYNTSFQSR